MATGGEHYSPGKSGEQTVEFKKVLANLVDITRALEANPDAARSLRRYLIPVGWISYTVDSLTPDGLMKVVLGRISGNVREYSVFISILGRIAGLDQIKKTIEETGFPVEESSKGRVEDSTEPESYAIAHDNEIEKRKVGRATSGHGTPSKATAQVVQNATTVLDQATSPEPSEKGISVEPKQHLVPGAALMDFPDTDDNVTTSLERYAEPSSEGTGVGATAPSVMISGNKSDHQQENLLVEKLQLEENLKSKEEKMAKMEMLVKKLESKIEEYERELHKKTEENKELRKENNEYSRKNDALLEKIREAKDLKQKAESQCTALSMEVEELKTEVKMLNEKVNVLEEKAADKCVVEQRFREIEAQNESEKGDRERRDKYIEEQLAEMLQLLKTKSPPSSARNSSSLDNL